MIKNNEETCKGIIYRYTKSCYENDRGDIIITDKFVFQKRMSCKGCCKCGDLREILTEEILINKGVEIRGDMNEGSYYRLCMNSYHDPYTNEYDQDIYLLEVRIKNE